MSSHVRRAASRTSSLAVLAIFLPAMAWAQGAAFQFNIPAEDLGTALRAYARVTGEQVAFDSAATNASQSVALVGNFSADQGLKMLLSHSDLIVERSSSGVLMVRPKNVQAASNNGAAERAQMGRSRLCWSLPRNAPSARRRSDISFNFGGAGNRINRPAVGIQTGASAAYRRCCY